MPAATAFNFIPGGIDAHQGQQASLLHAPELLPVPSFLYFERMFVACHTAAWYDHTVMRISSPLARSVLAAALALVMYGGWAYAANRVYGRPAAQRAALLQGSFSFTITMTMTLI